MAIPAHSSITSRVKSDGCDRCHYCDLTFAHFHHEHDHAPVPKCAGGENTVPACTTCHDLKDRAGIRGWPASEGVEAVQSLIARGLFGDTILSVPPTDWPQEWHEMGRWERLMWGRVVALSHRGEPPTDLLWMALEVSA